MASKTTLCYFILCYFSVARVRSSEDTVVKSPGFPGNYTTDNNGWFQKINVPSNQRVKLVVNTMDLNPDDKLYVYNGHYCGSILASSYILKTYQGRMANLPDILFADTDEVCVELEANKGGGKGFSLTVIGIPACTGSYEKESGDVISPYYPSEYKYSTNCRWHITVPKGQRIEYKVRDFDLEVSKGCTETYMILTDTEGFTPQQKLCQPGLKGQTIHSRSHKSEVVFSSEKSIWGSIKGSGHKGFWLRYRALNATGCELPGDPLHGRQIVTGRFDDIGGKVKFECNPGYDMIGSSIITCVEGWVWDRAPPTCQAKTCKLGLKAPPNGRIEITSNTYGSVVTYTCNSGYYLDGASKRQCTATGEWSDESPICKVVRCKKPRAPASGSVTVGALDYGSTATFHCDRGLVLNGPKTITCLTTGEWSDDPPTCSAAKCPELRPIINGQLMTSRRTVGSEAILICNPGFFFDKAHTLNNLKLICLEDATWSGKVRDCLYGSDDGTSGSTDRQNEKSITGHPAHSIPVFITPVYPLPTHTPVTTPTTTGFVEPPSSEITVPTQVTTSISEVTKPTTSGRVGPTTTLIGVTSTQPLLVEPIHSTPALPTNKLVARSTYSGQVQPSHSVLAISSTTHASSSTIAGITKQTCSATTVLSTAQVASPPLPTFVPTLIASGQPDSSLETILSTQHVKVESTWLYVPASTPTTPATSEHPDEFLTTRQAVATSKHTDQGTEIMSERPRIPVSTRRPDAVTPTPQTALLLLSSPALKRSSSSTLHQESSSWYTTDLASTNYNMLISPSQSAYPLPNTADTRMESEVYSLPSTTTISMGRMTTRTPNKPLLQPSAVEPGYFPSSIIPSALVSSSLPSGAESGLNPTVSDKHEKDEGKDKENTKVFLYIAVCLTVLLLLTILTTSCVFYRSWKELNAEKDRMLRGQINNQHRSTTFENPTYRA